MSWVYLSPHFDDVALSCGGLVWEQSRSHQPVDIWTICAAEPPQGDLSPFAQALHSRWQFDRNAPEQRRKEDVQSCQQLGAVCRYFTMPDCIYRRHPHTNEFMYALETSINGPLHPGDMPLVQDLTLQLQQSLEADAILVCPLSLGNHVDHQLTRQAAEGTGLVQWYYADFPYVRHCKAQLEQLEQSGWESKVFQISPPGLTAWQDAISAYGSQISTFWADELDMRQSVSDYLDWYHGIRLWKKPAN
jgi:LmbE family N-acetylglucosaminyl deacetylase